MNPRMDRHKAADPFNPSEFGLHRAVYIRNQAQHFKTLGDVIFEHYKMEGPLELLVAVGLLYRQSLDLVAIANDDGLIDIHPGVISLAQYHMAVFELHHDITALESAMICYRRALDLLEVAQSHSSHERSLAQVGLAQALFHRYRALSCIEDGHKALQILAEISEPQTPTQSDQLGWVFIVASLIRSDSKISNIVPVTSVTLEGMLSQVRIISTAHFLRSQHLLASIAQVGLSRTLCHLTENRQHTITGLDISALALRQCPVNAHVLRCAILSERLRLFDAAHMHHWDIGQEPLGAVMSTAEAILDNPCSQHNSYVRSFARSFWAEALIQRSMDNGDYERMEEAVDSMKQALRECPLPHLFRPGLVCYLSYLLKVYFQYSGQVSVLDELILLRDLHFEYMDREPYLAGNIAEMMLVRAQLADTDTARLLITQAVKLCQNRIMSQNFALDDKPERGALNVHLVNASRMQLQLGLAPILDLDDSLELIRRALVIEFNIPSRIRFILARAEILISKASRDNEASFLSEATAFLEEELESESLKTSLYQVDVYAAQAYIFVAQYDISGDRSLLQRAWELYSLAVTTSSGRWRNSFQCCLKWADCAAERSHDLIAYEAYSYAIDLLPRVVFLGEDIIGRIEALRQVNGLASSSVAIALTTGKVAEAVDFLERTRGILWLQSFHMQPAAGLDLLPVTLRSQYTLITNELSMADRMHWALRRRKVEQLNTVIEEIRCIPNLERFLLPPLLHELESLLQERGGRTIIIVPSTRACDVVTLGGPKGHVHLRLAALNIDKIRKLAQDFIRTHSTTRAMGQDQARRGVVFSQPPDAPELLRCSSTGNNLLAELWFSLVGPIFDSLGLMSEIPREMRQRVWWCPTGVLSSLPVHAAGVYSTTSDENVSKYAVSSYTSTLTALHRTLSEDLTGTTANTSAKVLLIGQPDSANFPSLPNARLEVECVQNIIPVTSLINDPKAHGISVNEALTLAAQSQILHIACHGTQDQSNPLNSGFELMDGRLTLGQLMNITSPNAQLAYLSACESAGMDESRPDEGLNLAGAMIFAGFKSVIATMWAMDDVDGPFMAEHIYQQIFRDGKLDMSMIPYAVDDAIRELRSSGVSVSRWATYVHFGV